MLFREFNTCLALRIPAQDCVVGSDHGWVVSDGIGVDLNGEKGALKLCKNEILILFPVFKGYILRFFTNKISFLLKMLTFIVNSVFKSMKSECFC